MNKKIGLLLFLVLFVFQMILAQVKIEKSTDIRIIKGKEYYIHYIEKGHTLFSLARLYEIPIDEIVFENPFARNQLLIGQRLKIPVKSRDKEIEQSLRNENSEFFYHIVKEGQNLKSIAKIYLVSYRSIRAANPSLYDPLKLGQYIKVPVKSSKHPGKNKETAIATVVKERAVVEKPPQLPKYYDHIVKKGENLYRIAYNYKVSIDDIRKVNPYVSETLSIGQYIKIPTNNKKTDYIEHTTQRREKLEKLAKNYNLNIQDLRKANPTIRNRVRAGEVLKIPIKQKLNIIIEEKKTEFPLISEFIDSADFNQGSINCFSNPENRNQLYRVALMIPLYLEDVDSLKYTENIRVDEFVKNPPFKFIQFYYGVMMAVDSLNKLGLNIELTVYDVDKNIGKTIKVLQDKNLQKQDLIIGPFYHRSFDLATRFSQIFKIPIVNPLAKRSKIVQNNSLVYKIQPTKDSQHKYVKDLVDTHFRNSKVFFIKHRKKLKEREFPLYRNEITHLLDSGYSIANEKLFELVLEKSLVDTTILEDNLLSSISIEGQIIETDSLLFNMYDSTFIENRITQFYYAKDSIHGFEDNASIYRNNVAFIFTDDNVFALDLMTKLNILRDTFAVNVVGLPDWRDMTNLDNELMSNLNVHLLSREFVDYKDYNVNMFIHDFRKKYLTEPLDYAFKGFDISWYFLNALMSFGSSFENCLPYYNPTTIQTKFKFQKRNQNDGFENQYWKVLKYDKYRLNEVDINPIEPSIDSIDRTIGARIEVPLI